jgi:RNase P/RNase MRP subunit p29
MHIGKTITITEAKNKSILNKTGKVIDETKHTITIQPSTPPNQSSKPKDITLIKDQIITIKITEEQP